MTEPVEGQLSLFDLDTWFGRTFQDRCPQTKEKTSKPSSRKSSASQTRTLPMCLCLKRSGHGADASTMTWADGALLGEFTMLSFGESPSEENESLLSQILVDSAHPKYSLSEKACAGILNRANRRGKKLPEQLEQALMSQIHSLSKCGGGREIDSHGKRAGKGALIQTEMSGTIGVAQDQSLFQTVAIEGNGTRESHHGGGYAVTDTMFTLNSTEQHAVAAQTTSVGVTKTYRKQAHPMNTEMAQGYEETSVSDTLNIFDNTEARTPTLILNDRHESDCAGTSSERFSDKDC